MSSPIMSAILLAVSASTAQPVTLARSHPVRSGIDGFPRIAVPADDALRRINRALDRLDSKVREAVRDCLSGGAAHPGNRSWRIDTPMHGPESSATSSTTMSIAGAPTRTMVTVRSSTTCVRGRRWTDGAAAAEPDRHARAHRRRRRRPRRDARLAPPVRPLSRRVRQGTRRRGRGGMPRRRRGAERGGSRTDARLAGCKG